MGLTYYKKLLFNYNLKIEIKIKIEIFEKK